jgi:large subunit ribosomal protein L23
MNSNKAKQSKKKVGSVAPVALSSDYGTLVRPFITEKASHRGLLVMEVLKESTKEDIKRAVETIFGVRVAGVRTINLMGKPKRKGTSVGRRRARKKAYITLAEGQTVDLIEGV